jgi:co-chaperonin GroES (HSP10)
MTTKEPLSTSTPTEEIPKLKPALEEKYKSEPEKEVTKEETKLPMPTGWRMLVLPFRMKEKTEGGVIIGTETIDRQQVASQCGNVIAMGPDCYNDPKRFNDGPWCKIGDWVVFARYAGSRIEIEGGEVRLLNDDEILATVQDPTDILHKY